MPHSRTAHSAAASLHQTTITIYTRYDTSALEIDELARRAMDGDAYCAGQPCRPVNADALPEGARLFFQIDGDDERGDVT